MHSLMGCTLPVGEIAKTLSTLHAANAQDLHVCSRHIYDDVLKSGTAYIKLTTPPNFYEDDKK